MRRLRASVATRLHPPRSRHGVAPLVWVVAALVPLAVLAPALPSGAASAPTSAPDRVTFGLAPASATGPDGRPALDYTVSPGEVISDHVAALNYSDQPLTLRLYASDAVETNLG